jgi:hypothetical protein
MVDADTLDPLGNKHLPWARMTYFWKGPAFDFVFNAHNLPPTAETEWVLTYQPQPMPVVGILCLGSGKVNDGGNIHIVNSIELDSDLPIESDVSDDGATLALVVAEDVDCNAGEMNEWIPEDYLFTTSPVIYKDAQLTQ